ncbi:MAG: hypothetical protein PUG73_04150 [Pseudomonadota bacterium]|nr:hypothetical protein [Pseudomonadota bacterium]
MKKKKDKTSLAEVHERLNNLEPLHMPSVKEFLEFDGDGATREYEKTYLALLDNVRDKTTDEKIAYIKEYVPSLRRQVSLMASTRDMLYTSETDDGLAFILVYRYEHHISIFDDLELEMTREPAEEYLYKLARIEMRKEREAEMEFKRTHPEEYERQRRIKLEEAKARGKKCAEDIKKLFADMRPEDWL